MTIRKRNRTYLDLAEKVAAELTKRGQRRPARKVLTDLFERMYYASLMTEESETISFHVVYLDPDAPDPQPPNRIRNDRWMFVRFEKQLPLTIPTLIKLAKASDPRTSSFATMTNEESSLSGGSLIKEVVTTISSTTNRTQAFLVPVFSK